jgi:peptide/nickel transport system substrate-binding protein
MSNYFATNGTQNWGKYSNADVDAALKEARTSAEQGVQRRAYAVVQQEIVRDVPSVFYLRPTYLVVHSKNVHGVSAISDGSPLWTKVSTAKK